MTHLLPSNLKDPPLPVMGGGWSVDALLLLLTEEEGAPGQPAGWTASGEQ